MKIALFSSTLNHHQLPFCLEMEKLLGKGNFIFVSSMPLTEERALLGFPDLNNQYSFVLESFEDSESYQKAYELALDCDVAIFGVAPEIFIKTRVKHNKTTFRYQERIFKKSRWHILKPWVFSRIIWNHTKYNHKKLYMLCAGAFTAGDYRLGRAYRNKCFRWGYFSKLNIFDIEESLNKRKNKRIKLLWVGRFLKWKHPENAVLVAEFLMKEGYDFQLDMLGVGPEEEKIKDLINEKGVKGYVALHGSVQVDRVLEFMRESNIFIFTSNREEGWGVVLNEAMNCGCAIVANSQIGSVPYLIKDGYNGYIYNNNIKDLCSKVEELFCNEKLRNQFAINAYKTIIDEWNPKNAAKKFIRLIEDIEKGGNGDLFSDGVLSIDKIKL